jgi:Holliday junction resolvase
MSSKNGNAAAAEARGIPEFDLLGSGVDRENRSASAEAQATAPRASRPGGARHRQKGNRTEREVVDRHKAVGVHAERYPLSGASRFRGAGHGVDIYAFGADEAPIVAEVNSRESGAGFTTLKKWLGEYDPLFLRRNHADPLVCIRWRLWVRLLERVRR